MDLNACQALFLSVSLFEYRLHSYTKGYDSLVSSFCDATSQLRCSSLVTTLGVLCLLQYL